MYTAIDLLVHVHGRVYTARVHVLLYSAARLVSHVHYARVYVTIGIACGIMQPWLIPGRRRCCRMMCSRRSRRPTLSLASRRSIPALRPGRAALSTPSATSFSRTRLYMILSVCRIPNEGARHGRKLILPPAPARHAASGDLWLPHADLVARVAAAGFEYTHEWAEGDYLAALG